MVRQRDYGRIKVGDTIVYKTGLVIGISYGNFCFYKEHLINSVVSGHSKFHVGCVMVGKNSWFVSRQMISGVIDKNGKLKYFMKPRKKLNIRETEKKLFSIKFDGNNYIDTQKEILTDEWEYVGTDLKIITTLKKPHGDISGARKTGRKYRFISRGKYELVDKLEKPVDDLVEKYSKLQVKHIKLQQEYLDLLKKGEN